jgi:hypothetical protein
MRIGWEGVMVAINGSVDSVTEYLVHGRTLYVGDGPQSVDCGSLSVDEPLGQLWVEAVGPHRPRLWFSLGF